MKDHNVSNSAKRYQANRHDDYMLLPTAGADSGISVWASGHDKHQDTQYELHTYFRDITW